MPKLIDEFADLDQKVLLKKEELAAKILPLIQEFVQETGLLVRSIEPDYIDVTTMEGRLRDFLVDSAKIYTDVDVRGIGNRKVGR